MFGKIQGIGLSVGLILLISSTLAAVDDCTQSQFWDGTVCVSCSPCPPGFGVKTKCSRKLDTECEACIAGFDYSDTNGFERCFGCDEFSNCYLGNSKEVKKCTKISSRVCDGCQDGNYFNPGTGGCQECSPPCRLNEDETTPCNTKHDRMCSPKTTVSTTLAIRTDSPTSSVKGTPTSTAQGETKQPTDPAIAPDKSRQSSSIPSVEKGLWGVVSGTVVLLVVAVPIAVAVAVYKRKRHATAAGERLNNQQRRPLILGLDQPISNLSIEGRRFISQRLNRAYPDGFFYWQTCADKCGLRAVDCESWKRAENPAEKFLGAYGEKAGSTIRKLVEVLKVEGVDLTQIANEIEDKFSLPQDQGENENVVETEV